MKVTVCFDDAKVVVPCGDGSNNIQYLINEAYSRYKRVAPKGKDFINVDINDIKLNLKDGGILDPDDKIVDVIEDKEQILAIFHGKRDLSRENSDTISSPIDLRGRVQGHSSPLSDENLVVCNGYEDSLNDNIYCTITAEDLRSNSHLKVTQNGITSADMPNGLQIFTDENLNEISKKISKEDSEKMHNQSITPQNQDGLFGTSSMIKPESVELITLKNDSPLLGIHVMPEYNNSQDVTGLRVRSIEKGGLAYKDGRLKCNDVIIEINDVSLFKVAFAEAQEIFKSARLESELRLKVIHKSGNGVIDKPEHNKIEEEAEDKDEEEVFDEDSFRGKNYDTALRKEYASMVNLRQDDKDLGDATHTVKSISMDDLTGENHSRRSKECSSISDDEYIDGHFEREDKGKKSIKLMFADDQRFLRKNAYDSLNRAVDKFIDFDQKGDKQRIFKSVKPSPTKKQHWWSRLKFSKKSKDSSKKAESKTETPQPENVQSKFLKSKVKSDNDGNNNNNSSNKSNNNNNNKGIDKNKIVNRSQEPMKNKESIEWVHRVPWLGSSSDSLTLQTNSLSERDIKLDAKNSKPNDVVVQVPEEHFGIISGQAKLRSKSAAHMERKLDVRNVGPSTPPMSTMILHQSQARSSTDLRPRILQNDHLGGSDRSQWHAGARGTSQHNYDIYNPPPATRVPNFPLPAPRTGPMRQGEPPPMVHHSNPSALQSPSAYEMLFGRMSEVESPDARRVGGVLKESSSNRLRSIDMASPGRINNTKDQFREQRAAWNVDVPPRNHYYQFHGHKMNVYPMRYDRGTTLVGDGAGNFTRIGEYHNITNANQNTNEINKSPTQWTNPAYARDLGNQSKFSLPLSDDLLPHKRNYNARGIVIDHKSQALNLNVPSSSAQRFHHFQQRSDLTDYSSDVRHLMQAHSGDFYGVIKR